MHRARNATGYALNTPIGWNMVPEQGVSNEEFLFVLAKNGFQHLPDMITWDQYKGALHAYFPNRIRADVCKRCLGGRRDNQPMHCMRCGGRGLEAG